MKNKELITIYKKFCNQIFLLNHTLRRRNIESIEGYGTQSKGNVLNCSETWADAYNLRIKDEVVYIHLESMSKLFDQLKSYFNDIDFTQFNISELEELGWQIWDENLILAPTWVIDYCKDGTCFTSISDEKQIKGKDRLDLDTRFGSTAYGLLISDLRDSKLESILEL